MLTGNREAVPLVLFVVMSVHHNDQIRPKAVEHNYFQGETSFLSTCDKITFSCLHGYK